jgi:hypothetical protein
MIPWYGDQPADGTLRSWEAPGAGSLTNLFLRHNGLGTATEVITYEVFKNGAATGFFVALDAGTTSGSETTGSVSFVAGDFLDLKATHAGLTTTPTQIQATANFGIGNFGDDYQSVASTSRQTTAGAAFILKTGATITTPALTGTYRLGWHAIMDNTNQNGHGEARLQNTTDAVTIGGPDDQLWEPSDVDEREDMNGFGEVVFGGAAKTFEIQFRHVTGPGSTGLQDARIELWRVA